MVRITETERTIVWENNHAEITVSRENAMIETIFDKKSGTDIRAREAVPFFVLQNKAQECIPIRGLSLSGNVLTVEAENGTFELEIRAFENYFTFELVSSLPAGTYRAFLANAGYRYDYTDKTNTAAVGIAMTVSVNPTYFPDGKSMETRAQIYPHLADTGAKYALIIAPIVQHREIIKEVCLTIDRSKGICSTTGGAWGRDSRLNFSNYTIQHQSTRAFIEENIPFFRSIGVDQIDFHKGAGTFRQGDFKFMQYENAAGFKENVSDVLAKNGMAAGLHTYSQYIDPQCEPILSKPEYQAQLKIMDTFTLAADIDESTGFLPTEESTECVSSDFGFCQNNTPYLLIDNEIIRFQNHPHGFTVTQRGIAGTLPAAHKKGAAIKHLEGHYHGLTPVLGSELFYEIARNTAKAYNEGGFSMIYLDALDGMSHHCDITSEYWYYTAAFVCEVLRYCRTDPVLEGADYTVGMWAARGRIGAWDTAFRGYKGWNKRHTESNKQFIDRHGAPILGWYDYYPMTDSYPGNEHTKYHHTDAIEHMGSLAVMYDFANVFNGTTKEALERYPGMKRNIALYKTYDDLRKAQYFSEEYRQKLIDSPYEVHLRAKRGGHYVFVEKDYQTAKLYDLSDSKRNTGTFRNPFGRQIPFIRIEAMLSASHANPIELLPLNEELDLTEQTLTRDFEGNMNLKNNLAKTVRIRGNGKKGGKIAIKLLCTDADEAACGEYIIDTDFRGWREFILIESDNGERTDHGFEKNSGNYVIYRNPLIHNMISGIAVETEGDMTGVRMSSVLACEHTYEILKNPTVRIGETSVMFECELMSSDFIEFDGKTARVIDRYGNEKTIWFHSDLKAPRGRFNAELTAHSLNRCTPRAQLTFGFTGKEIK